MNEFAREMIETQLIPRGIRNNSILTAMGKIPRELFVPSHFSTQAYTDHPLPIGAGQTISQPYMVAWMTELLDVKVSDSVLEIGTGSGYQTAVLAELAKEVYSVEVITPLSIQAQALLNQLGYRNIHFRISDGSIGWEEKAPFDRIVVTAGSPSVPYPLFAQLTEGGKLVIPVGEREMQQLLLVEKIHDQMSIKSQGACVFVPLTGKYGVQQ